LGLTADITKYLFAITIIVTVIAILGYLNYQVAFSKKIKIFINIIVLIAAAAWLLDIFGLLGTVIVTISNWIKSF
jgi:hypothetical protein